MAVQLSCTQCLDFEPFVSHFGSTSMVNSLLNKWPRESTSSFFVVRHTLQVMVFSPFVVHFGWMVRVVSLQLCPADSMTEMSVRSVQPVRWQ